MCLCYLQDGRKLTFQTVHNIYVNLWLILKKKKKKPIIRTFDLNVPIKKLKEIKERILSLVLSSSRENISADKGACLNVTFQKNFTNVEVGSRFLHSTVEVFTESLCVREIQLLFCL